MALRYSKVRRSGVTATQWNDETNKIELGRTTSGGFTINFQIKSAGGGMTDVQVDIGKNDFNRVLEQIRDIEAAEARKLAIRVTQLERLMAEVEK